MWTKWMVLKGIPVWLKFGKIYNTMVLKEVALYKVVNKLANNG